MIIYCFIHSLLKFAKDIMEDNQYSDEILISKFQQGDRDAYTKLVNKYKDRIVNFIYRYMGDFDVAQDLAQDTFYKLYINIIKSNWL